MPQDTKLPRRSTGENWTESEDEKLRVLYLELCKRMAPRSPASVFARIHVLRDRRFYVWPEVAP